MPSPQHCWTGGNNGKRTERGPLQAFCSQQLVRRVRRHALWEHWRLGFASKAGMGRTSPQTRLAGGSGRWAP
eukprot:6737581-Pyramimonas_sp.AAC.1